MPRDPRPYLTYPIGYTIHPRIDMLSDAAFRAFHEMNDYCRINRTDGKIVKPLAAKRWSARVLKELLAGDGERPLVVLDGDSYFLRSYAEHQFTNDDAETLRLKRVEAGRTGGLASGRARGKQSRSKVEASAEASASLLVKQKGEQNEAESKSESKLTSDTNQLDPKSLELNARELSSEEIVGCRKVLEKFGVESRDELAAVTLVELLVEASPRPVTNIVGYIVRCTQRSPQKVRSLAVEAERQAAQVRLAVAS